MRSSKRLDNNANGYGSGIGLKITFLVWSRCSGLAAKSHVPDSRMHVRSLLSLNAGSPDKLTSASCATTHPCRLRYSYWCSVTLVIRRLAPSSSSRAHDRNINRRIKKRHPQLLFNRIIKKSK